jgi:hypothetical protein
VRVIAACAGFDEVAFHAPEAIEWHDKWSVGVHRLTAQPQSLQTGRHWFTFFVEQPHQQDLAGRPTAIWL